MKRLQILLITLLLYNNCFSFQVRKTELNAEAYDVIGQVKTITTFYYGDYASFQEFNSNNLLIENYTVYLNGKYFSKNSYYYDDASNLIEVSDYNNKGGFVGCSKFEYDKNNNKITERQYIGEIEQGSGFHYKYQKSSNVLIEILNLKSNGTVFTKSIFEYDNYGNKLKKTFISNFFKDTLKSNYKYDSNHNLIEENIADQITKYRLENGNIIEEQFSYNNSLQTISNYKHNKHGMIISLEKEFISEGAKSINIFKYDAFKNVTYDYSITGGGFHVIEESIYKYDQNKNWIEKKTKKKSKLKKEGTWIVHKKPHYEYVDENGFFNVKRIITYF